MHPPNPSRSGVEAAAVVAGDDIEVLVTQAVFGGRVGGDEIDQCGGLAAELIIGLIIKHRITSADFSVLEMLAVHLCRMLKNPGRLGVWLYQE